MKVLFLGTPEFSVDTLKALVASSHEVVGVVTQPDRALKRGKIEACAVKTAAIETGLPVFQPEKLRLHVDELKAFGADIAVTAAYGQILNAEILNAFPLGVLNVHASILPKYRGASPIQSAIAAGETVSGVTIMRTELGIDTGDIMSVVKTEIGEQETAGELTVRLAALGAKLLVDTLDDLDKITPIKQDDALATHCKMISKDEQYIDFATDAKTVVDKIRSLSPTPCAKTAINGEVYKIFAAERIETFLNGKPGEIIDSKDKLVIACATGAISVKVIQAPSKRAMNISEFINGRRFDVGVICEKQL